jgi:hypothetical protein
MQIKLRHNLRHVIFSRMRTASIQLTKDELTRLGIIILRVAGA